MNVRTMVVAVAVCLPGAALAQEAYGDQPAPVQAGTRFRWGVNGQIGAFIINPLNIDFGVSARFGAQLSDMLGVYAQLGYNAGIGFGGSVSSTGASVGISAMGYYYIAAMGEVDVGPNFFLAAGPMIANGGWAAVGEGADSSGAAHQYAIAAGGWMPGLDARTGFTFGKKDSTGRHGGFTLAVELQLLYAEVTSVGQAAGGGTVTQSVSVGSHTIGITPMLVLGYDAK